MSAALIHLLRASEHAPFASRRTRRLLREATARLTTANATGAGGVVKADKFGEHVIVLLSLGVIFALLMGWIG